MRAETAFINIQNVKHVHFMGVGGAGMSGLALLLKAMDFEVSGCDMVNTFYLERVRARGVEILMGHHREHLDHFAPDLIIYTSAIAQDHPELVEARKRGIAVARRAEILSILFNARKGIGVAGTHGKTTTSSMISLIAERAGLAPTVAIGGELCDIGCNAKLGRGEYMVAELDESDGSFELFSPDVAVVTNIDWDHIDHYPTFENVFDAFSRFADGRKEGAALVICGEDDGASRLLEMKRGDEKNIVSYGWGSGWDWGATEVRHAPGGGVVYTAIRSGEAIGDITLKVSGEHNVLNSLASLAAAGEMGIPFAVAAEALSSFTGAKRRMQLVGEAGDVTVYDDYAHHPSEIYATLGTVGNMFPNRRLHVIFQPHRYTRTAALFKGFAGSLASAEHVYLLPIYSADEQPIADVSSFMIADELAELGRDEAVVCRDFREATNLVCDNAKPGDLVLTIGAGNVELIGRQILRELERRYARSNVSFAGA